MASSTRHHGDIAIIGGVSQKDFEGPQFKAGVHQLYKGHFSCNLEMISDSSTWRMNSVGLANIKV